MNIQTTEPRRILLVDDNPAIHEDFRKILSSPTPAANSFTAAEVDFFGEAAVKQRLPHFEIDSAFQGDEALQLVEKSIAEQRPYAMAFMDVRMPPGLDGIQTTCKLWERCPTVQIAICTAYSDYSWETMVEKLGFSDRLVLLKKPFDVIEVCQIATCLTEKWRLAQESKFQTALLQQVVAERTRALQSANLELSAVNAQLAAANERLKAVAVA